MVYDSKVFMFFKKLYQKSLVLLFDLMAIPMAWYLAYWFRYNFHPFSVSYSSKALLILSIIQVVCYYHYKVYRGVWRFASMNDLLRIIRAVTVAVLIVFPVLYLFSLLQDIPRSILPLYGVFLIGILSAARLTRRILYESIYSRLAATGCERVLIIGAGRAGESLARELLKTRHYQPIGFIDDNPLRLGLEIHGISVLGSLRELSPLTIKHQVDLIFIAIPSAGSVEMRRIVGECEKSAIPFRTLPSFSALAAGKVEVTALRDVRLEDLLGRDQVYLEWDKIVSGIQGRRIVVTGGGGSIGSELCRQLIALKPASVMIVDNCEFNLYQVQMEFSQKFPDTSFSIALLSVTDFVGIQTCFTQFKPDIVFHAAAYKHVPMLENQSRVAVLNNVIGTQVVAEVSAECGVAKFVLISSDKAVNPTNMMGTTKRVAEIFCQNLNGHVETQFITVRFGNVLGSAGSVVPLFQRQINAGGPVTVTHPDMTRYFMTIPEACQLILQAMVNGQGGEIFVLDMGEPVKIRYLAEQMIKLSGQQPDKDINIVYTGVRPGEKLFEELFHQSEALAPTGHQKLFMAGYRRFDWSELMETFHLLSVACHENHEEEIYILLNSLVPESQVCQQLLLQE